MTNNKKNNQDVAPDLELLVYDENSHSKNQLNDAEELDKIIDKSRVNLIIINNPSNTTLIEGLTKYFDIHPMVVEDALSGDELPKVQESGDHLLLTLKVLDLSASGELLQKHLGMILGDYYVIVFNESEHTVFEDITSRIENGKSKARFKKSDYLFYLLTDSVIDSYYSIVNEIDNKIDKMEVVLLEKPDANYISHLYRIKQPMSDLRGILYAIREALLNIVQGDFELVEDETLPFLHDVKDHISNIVHMFDASRDTLSDLLEINNSNINNRLNRTMKVLTVITTLFVPLTLISGIYGMNFKHMPELSWKYGYPLALAIMLVVSGIILYIMKRKKLL